MSIEELCVSLRSIITTAIIAGQIAHIPPKSHAERIT